MCYNRQAKATLDGGEGGGGVVTRRRVDRVISLSHNTSIYVFTHALAYHHHPLSDDDDDATLQMNPITHQGGRPSPISLLRVRVSVSLPLPAADRDFSSGLQWRIGSMDDGRTDGRTDGPLSLHPLRPSTLIPLSCPLIRITPESSSLHSSRKHPLSQCVPTSCGSDLRYVVHVSINKVFQVSQ